MRNHGGHKLNLQMHSPTEIGERIHHRIQTKTDRNTTLVVVCPNGDVAYGPRQKGLVKQVLDDVDGADRLVGEYVKTCLVSQIINDLKEWICKT